MPISFNASYCTPKQYKFCADPALDWLVQASDSDCICGTPCNVTKYSLSTSQLRLPSTYGSPFYEEKYTRSSEYIKNNFVKLNIFFEALNYESVEQKAAYEFSGLLGDIGGNMGLFIGASLLTIIELLDFTFEVLKGKCILRGWF